MKLLVWVLLCFVLGCSPSWQVEARSADAVVRVANASLPVLVEAYRAEGERAIASAPTVDAARASLARVRERWAPVWRAWDASAAAYDAWLVVFEGGADPAALRGASARLREAYCLLRASVPADVRLPDVLVVSC